MAKNLEGATFGKLTVVRRTVSDDGRARWECLCECGTSKVVRQDSLLSGRTTSCECQKGPRMAALGAASKTHGASVGRTHSREYASWSNMIVRCTNARTPAFRNYGGRGITVHPQWRESFEAFLKDMGPCPAGLTLERRENNGNYEPGNCVWADRFTQANNQRHLRRLSAMGKTLTIGEWAREIGVSRDRLYGALYRRDFSLGAAMKSLGVPVGF